MYMAISKTGHASPAVNKLCRRGDTHGVQTFAKRTFARRPTGSARRHGQKEVLAHLLALARDGCRRWPMQNPLKIISIYRSCLDLKILRQLVDNGRRVEEEAVVLVQVLEVRLDRVLPRDLTSQRMCHRCALMSYRYLLEPSSSRGTFQSL